jgi:O-glycosyl hydrolase
MMASGSVLASTRTLWPGRDATGKGAIMAIPWSAPGWMKTSGNMACGSLISGDESVFAQYLTEFTI